MIVFDGDKLVHVDLSEEIIEHFGVRGMKWGDKKNGYMKVGQLSGGIQRRVAERNALKRKNSSKAARLKKNDPKYRELVDQKHELTNLNKKAARLKKNDPKYRELVDQKHELTNLNKKAELRLKRNMKLKKVAKLGFGAASTAAGVYATNPEVRSYVNSKIR